MSYNIYVNGKLSAVAKDEISCVMRSNAYHKQGIKDVKVFEVTLDSVEVRYDWWKAYNELCYG